MAPRYSYKTSLSIFRISASTFTGLTVHGADPYPNPPLLQVAHAEVGVRIVSVLHRKWYLDSFVVDRPVVKVFTDAHGVTNIPVIKSSGSSSSNTSLFDLGIRHAVLDQGAVYYNNRQSVLSADLHNVDFRASFDSLQQKYSGRLSYSDGHLQSGTFKPIPHNLDAEFDATPTTFHLSQAKLTSETSQLLLTATVADYSHPQVQANYVATLDGSQFRKILQNPTVPVGLIRASGSIAYQEVANRYVAGYGPAPGRPHQPAARRANAHASIADQRHRGPLLARKWQCNAQGLSRQLFWAACLPATAR